MSGVTARRRTEVITFAESRTMIFNRPFAFNNSLLAIGQKGRDHPVKSRGSKAMVVVMLFWGLSFAALGWLVFKIAERM